MKRLMMFIMLLICVVSIKAQETGITGVITYFFNDYQGDKPDIGAVVYVLDSSEYFNSNFKLIDDYLNALTNVSLINFYSKDRTEYENFINKYSNRKKYINEVEEKQKELNNCNIMIKSCYDHLKKYNAETNDKLSELEEKAASKRRELQDSDFFNVRLHAKRTISGTGDYKILLPEGTYYVIVISKGRESLNQLEIQGKVELKEIKIKNNELVDFSYNFKY